MLLSTSAEQGEIERGEQEIVDKVFDFADKDVADVMVPRPDVLALSVDMPAEEVLRVVLDSPYTRYPVFRESLDEIVGVLHVRDLDRGDARPRHRGRRARGAAPSGADGPGDEGPAGAARRVQAHEAAHGDRDRRVRDDGGHRHARGSARGDRRRDHRRVRRARGGVDRARRRRHGPHRRDDVDRRLQRPVRGRPARRRLPHGRGLRVRRARPHGRAGRRGHARRHRLPRRRGRGPAHRASHRHVRLAARRRAAEDEDQLES